RPRTAGELPGAHGGRGEGRRFAAGQDPAHAPHGRLHSRTAAQASPRSVMTWWGPRMSDANLLPLRCDICYVNQMLPPAGLVTMPSGKASGSAPHPGGLVIKPSGMDIDQIPPDTLGEVDLETGVVLGELRPSVDLPPPRSLYRHFTGVGSIVHTHSPYATAF